MHTDRFINNKSNEYINKKRKYNKSYYHKNIKVDNYLDIKQKKIYKKIINKILYFISYSILFIYIFYISISFMIFYNFINVIPLYKNSIIFFINNNKYKGLFTLLILVIVEITFNLFSFNLLFFEINKKNILNISFNLININILFIFFILLITFLIFFLYIKIDICKSIIDIISKIYIFLNYSQVKKIFLLLSPFLNHNFFFLFGFLLNFVLSILIDLILLFNQYEFKINTDLINIFYFFIYGILFFCNKLFLEETFFINLLLINIPIDIINSFKLNKIFIFNKQNYITSLFILCICKKIINNIIYVIVNKKNEKALKKQISYTIKKEIKVIKQNKNQFYKKINSIVLKIMIVLLSFNVLFFLLDIFLYFSNNILLKIYIFFDNMNNKNIDICIEYFLYYFYKLYNFLSLFNFDLMILNEFFLHIFKSFIFSFICSFICLILQQFILIINNIYFINNILFFFIEIFIQCLYVTEITILRINSFYINNINYKIFIKILINRLYNTIINSKYQLKLHNNLYLENTLYENFTLSYVFYIIFYFSKITFEENIILNNICLLLNCIIINVLFQYFNF